MRVLTIQARAIGPESVGAVFASDTPLGNSAGRAKKGTRLTADLLPALAALGDREITIILPDGGDMGQDEAGRQLAEALAGPGTVVHGPVAGQMSLRAAHDGLLRVDASSLQRINELDRVAVFTLFDNQLVKRGQEVAGAKVTALVVPRSIVATAVALARVAGGIVRVRPLVPRQIGVLVSGRMREGARRRFRVTIQRKLRLLGSDAPVVTDAARSVPATRAAIHALRAAGAEIILVAGGSWSNPAEPVFAVLAEDGMPLERLGLPADPGTYFWIAYEGELPIVGLPACATLAESTIVDLLVAKILAGERLTRAELATFGHGGLLTADTAFRLPRFDEPSKTGEAERRGRLTCPER